jgi:hypothetical protein
MRQANDLAEMGHSMLCPYKKKEHRQEWLCHNSEERFIAGEKAGDEAEFLAVFRSEGRKWQ